MSGDDLPAFFRFESGLEWVLGPAIVHQFVTFFEEFVPLLLLGRQFLAFFGLERLEKLAAGWVFHYLVSDGLVELRDFRHGLLGLQLQDVLLLFNPFTAFGLGFFDSFVAVPVEVF